jgi:hypothetical protein
LDICDFIANFEINAYTIMPTTSRAGHTLNSAENEGFRIMCDKMKCLQKVKLPKCTILESNLKMILTKFPILEFHIRIKCSHIHDNVLLLFAKIDQFYVSGPTKSAIKDIMYRRDVLNGRDQNLIKNIDMYKFASFENISVLNLQFSPVWCKCVSIWHPNQ